MILTHTRFGNIEFTAEDIITFEEGLIGFGDSTEFLMVPSKPGSPFSWLQSAQDPSLAFLTTDPAAFFEDYDPEISDHDAAQLGLTSGADFGIFVTSAIPVGEPRKATANLAAPILINLDTKRGKQVVLDNEAYTMRHPIFSEQSAPVQKLAA
jgi:flagellar assembly factor FliW